MRKFLEKVAYKIQRFMYGRYGNDKLSRFILVCAIVLLVIAFLFNRGANEGFEYAYIVGAILEGISFVLLAYTVFRTLSKNITKRQIELNSFFRIKNKIFGFFSLNKKKMKDKDHKYYKCPHCGANIRIVRPPKGKTITITCPKCNQEFEKRT